LGRDGDGELSNNHGESTVAEGVTSREQRLNNHQCAIVPRRVWTCEELQLSALGRWLRGRAALEMPPSPDMSVRVSQLAHQNTVRSSLTAKQPVSQCRSALAAASAKMLPQRVAA
jgi:hypothetical protein